MVKIMLNGKEESFTTLEYQKTMKEVDGQKCFQVFTTTSKQR